MVVVGGSAAEIEMGDNIGQWWSKHVILHAWEKICKS